MAIVVLTACSSYLAFPWLIPSGWIASRLSGRLQALMNRSVQIDSVRFGYTQGLSITGLRIAERDGFGGNPFFIADEVTIPLTAHFLTRPATMLAFFIGLSGDPFQEMHITRPQCRITISEDGQWNISDLNEEGGVRLPARSFEISDLTFHFTDQRDSASTPTSTRNGRQKIVLPYLKYTHDPQTGRARWRGRAEDKFRLDGDLASPRLSSSPELSGGGVIQWRGLDLQAAPPWLLQIAAIYPTQGVTDGTLQIRVAPDLSAAFEADVRLRDAVLHLPDVDHCPAMQEIRLSSTGLWNAQSRSWRFDTLRCEVPGMVVVEGRQNDPPAVVIDPASDEQVIVALRGRFESFEKLRALCSCLHLAEPEALRVAGPFDFDYGFRRRDTEETVHLAVNADEALVELAEWVALPAHEPKRLSLELARRQGEPFSLRESVLTIPGLRLALSASTTGANHQTVTASVSDPRPAQAPSRIELEVADLRSSLGYFPVLSDVTTWLSGSGALSLHHQWTPSPDGMLVSGSLSFGANPALTVADLFEIPPGDALTIEYSALSPKARDGSLEQLHVQLRCGDARIGTSGAGATLSFSSELPESVWDREKLRFGKLETRCSASVELTGLEEVAGLLPPLRNWLSANVPAGYDFAGPVLASLDLDGAIVNRNPLLRLGLMFDARNTRLQVGEVFNKPAGRPASLRLDYTYDGRPGKRYKSAAVQAGLEGARLESLWEWSGVSENAPKWNECAVQAELEIESLQPFLGHWPMLRAHGALQNTGGSGLVSLDAVLASSAMNDLQLQRFDLNIRAEPEFGAAAPSVSTVAQVWPGQVVLSGKTQARFTAQYDPPNWSVNGDIDLSATAVEAWPHLDKRRGVPASLRFAARGAQEPRASAGVAQSAPGWVRDAHAVKASIPFLELCVGSVSVSAEGMLDWPTSERASLLPRIAELAATVEVPDLTELAQIWPAISQLNPTGAIQGSGVYAHSDDGPRITAARLRLDEAALSTDSADLAAHGALEFADGCWLSDSLRMNAGTLQAQFSARGCPADPAHPLDLAVRINDWRVTADSPTDAAELVENLFKTVSFPQTGSLAHRAWRELRDAVNLDAGFHLDTLHVSDGLRRIDLQLSEVVGDLSWRDVDSEADLRGVCSAGLVQAHFQRQGDDQMLQFSLTDALSQGALQDRLLLSFPGLIAAGTIDCRYASGLPNDEPGESSDPPPASGELVIRGGTLRGKAAPDWVARILPGLDLAAFDFQLMHDWFTVHGDGRIHHQAIFQGDYYHLYADGWETQDGSVVYEIGVDLLAGLDSAYWTASGGGRIPLFRSETRQGPGGEVLEESVNYVPWQLVRALLWDANPIHMAYLALRQRM